MPCRSDHEVECWPQPWSVRTLCGLACTVLGVADCVSSLLRVAAAGSWGGRSLRECTGGRVLVTVEVTVISGGLFCGRQRAATIPGGVPRLRASTATLRARGGGSRLAPTGCLPRGRLTESRCCSTQKLRGMFTRMLRIMPDTLLIPGNTTNSKCVTHYAPTVLHARTVVQVYINNMPRNVHITCMSVTRT